MRQFVIWCAAVVALSSPVHGHEWWPKPSEAGLDALDALIRRCVAAGGLTRAKGPDSSRSTLSVSDTGKLKEAIASDRAALTPELRETIIALWVRVSEKEPLIALLRAVAEETRDERAVAYAIFFTGSGEQGHERFHAALQCYEEARYRFRALGDHALEATCLDNIGVVYRQQGDYPRSLDYHRQVADASPWQDRPATPRSGTMLEQHRGCLQ